jgi:hypothetical protein
MDSLEKRLNKRRLQWRKNMKCVLDTLSDALLEQFEYMIYDVNCEMEQEAADMEKKMSKYPRQTPAKKQREEPADGQEADDEMADVSQSQDYDQAASQGEELLAKKRKVEAAEAAEVREDESEQRDDTQDLFAGLADLEQETPPSQSICSRFPKKNRHMPCF